MKADQKQKIVSMNENELNEQRFLIMYIFDDSHNLIDEEEFIDYAFENLNHKFLLHVEWIVV